MTNPMQLVRGMGARSLLAGIALLAATVIAGADETITISGFAFKPATLTVKAGTTVVWVNDDAAPHIVADKASKFRSGTLAKGGKFSQTFAAAGTIDYFCSLHPSMTGKIVVTP